MRFDRGLRALLLAPFGGEAAIVEVARRRLAGSGEASVYALGPELSTGAPSADPAVVSFLFEPASSARRERLASVVARLPPGGGVVVVDHNAPRRAPVRWLATAYAALGARLLRGASPAARLRHPVARELQDLGLEVERLRLLRGELFQAVLARKPMG